MTVCEMENSLFPTWAREDSEKRRLFGLAEGYGASQLTLSDEDAVRGFLAARVTDFVSTKHSSELSNHHRTGFTSILLAEFGVVYSQVMRKNQAAWSRVNSLASDNCDPLAQAILAIGYCSGWFSKDDKLSNKYGNQCLDWLRAQQDKHSCYCLGQFYLLGIAVKVDYAEAVRIWRIAIKAGSELAQYSMGSCYEKGKGVEKDFKEAVMWYRLAAEQGHCLAQFCLGRRYANGEGVTKNVRAAARWYRMSADQGYCYAEYNLGCFYQKGQGVTQDLSKALGWFLLAADGGLMDAQYMVGEWYRGGTGVKPDLPEAVKWYRMAADQGHSGARYRLGFCHDAEGAGASSLDFVEAVQQYQLAAAGGYAKAQFSLGCCYRDGYGVAKDLQQAKAWIRLAAAQSHSAAQLELEQERYKIRAE